MIRFVIVDTQDIDQDMLNNCLQTSEETARKNADGTRAVLKFSTKNYSAKIKFESYKRYSRSEIEHLMQDQEWSKTTGQ